MNITSELKSNNTISKQLTAIITANHNSSIYIEESETFKQATKDYIIAMAKANLWSDCIIKYLNMNIESAISELEDEIHMKK